MNAEELRRELRTAQSILLSGRHDPTDDELEFVAEYLARSETLIKLFEAVVWNERVWSMVRTARDPIWRINDASRQYHEARLTVERLVIAKYELLARPAPTEVPQDAPE